MSFNIPLTKIPYIGTSFFIRQDSAQREFTEVRKITSTHTCMPAHRYLYIELYTKEMGGKIWIIYALLNGTEIGTHTG